VSTSLYLASSAGRDGIDLESLSQDLTTRPPTEIADMVLVNEASTMVSKNICSSLKNSAAWELWNRVFK
jgi:hypothetical protein